MIGLIPVGSGPRFLCLTGFARAKPTTTLGLFLTLLNSDDGDNFADEHGPAVDAIIAQLQAANVPLRSLAKTKNGGAL